MDRFELGVMHHLGHRAAAANSRHHAVLAAGDTLAILNAGKGEVYFQYFGPLPTEPAIGDLTEILNTYPGAAVASSMPLPPGYAAPKITHPRADALAMLAATRPGSALPPAPFYIRPPDAKPQMRKGGFAGCEVA